MKGIFPAAGCGLFLLSAAILTGLLLSAYETTDEMRRAAEMLRPDGYGGTAVVLNAEPVSLALRRESLRQYAAKAEAAGIRVSLINELKDDIKELERQIGSRLSRQTFAERQRPWWFRYAVTADGVVLLMSVLICIFSLPAIRQERKRRIAEERERRAAEERERQRRAAEERERQQRAAEARERQQRAAEARERQRRAAEERERQRRAAEARERQQRAAEERERQRRAAEERERQRRAAEERERVKTEMLLELQMLLGESIGYHYADTALKTVFDQCRKRIAELGNVDLTNENHVDNVIKILETLPDARLAYQQTGNRRLPFFRPDSWSRFEDKFANHRITQTLNPLK